VGHLESFIHYTEEDSFIVKKWGLKRWKACMGNKKWKRGSTVAALLSLSVRLSVCFTERIVS